MSGTCSMVRSTGGFGSADVVPTRGSRWVTAALIAAVLGLWGVPGKALAQVPSSLGPSSRPWFGQFAFGPALRLDNVSSQFKLMQAVGYHLNGGGDGLAVGGSLQESFGKGFTTIELGPCVWWDFQLVPDAGLYVAPFAQLGWGVLADGDALHRFNMQFGVEPRLVIDDRAMIALRLVTLDFLLGDPVGVRYDLLFSAGMTF